ncbi:putative endonuclease-reverse transcriptase [Trichonephila clavipes]|nr:putative endonuclease-reverse transcriptase [Trichonephila clavipes]
MQEERRKQFIGQKMIFFEDLFKNVEHIKGSNKSIAFFREINLDRKKFKPSTTSCHNRKGIILRDRTEVLRRWNEHFENLLNSDNGDHEALTESTETQSQGIVEPPSVEEVIEVINKLKDNKAPAPDTIPSELLKNRGKETSKKIYDLIQVIWEQEVIPKEWKMSITCAIHKNGDILECSNYRGISLLCSSHKVFSNILFNTLSPQVENTVGDYQNGFRKGRFTTEQISNIRQILEKTKEFGIDTPHLFIDFKTAYASIKRRILLQP